MKFKMGGSGIHIKPENKGKFTATKKATGKSTEELTHSKNPVTKKRAVFAQNAAKWKHEDGSKNVKSFPDLNKDGKVSRADVLVGRGVIPAKKMQMGNQATKANKKEYREKMVKELGDPTRVFKKAARLAKDLYKKPKETLSKLNPLNNVYEDLKSSSANDTVSKKMCGSKGMKYAEGTKSIKFKKPMMKRADGSYSQQGLYDNIRKNKGSGKKPTPEMLKQEKKIKAGK